MSNDAITRVHAAIIIIIVVVAALAVGTFMTRVPSGPISTTNSSVPNSDTFIYETSGQTASLDPAIDYDIRGQSISQNIYESLLFFKGETINQTIPWLASSYDVTPDGLTYTFHLRSGITFTDGTPFDANAVYFSIMRVLIIDDPDGPAWYMDYLRGAQNYSKSFNNAGPSAPSGYGDKYTKGELDDLLNAKPVEVIDARTVAFHLEHPYAAWPFIMATTTGEIVSPTAFKAHWTAPTDGTPYIDGATAGDYANQLNPWPATNAVGTAPYILQSWDRASGTIILVRNEHYWGGPDNTGIAPIANVIIKSVDEPNTKVLDLKAGTCDAIGIPVTVNSQLAGGLIFQFADKNTWLSQHKLVPISPDYQLAPTQGLWPQFTTEVMGFNQRIFGADGKPQGFQPFADLRIRKAFTLAFNRTAYIHDVLQDFAIPASQMLPPGMFGYDPAMQPTPYDLATAKQLLLDAGANPIAPEDAFGPTNTKTVQLAYGLEYASSAAAMTILASAINSMAKGTGLYAEVVGMTQAQLRVQRHLHQIQAFVDSWIYDYVDPDDFFVPFAYSKGHYGPSIGYNNPEVDSLIAKQASTVDATQRLQIISQIQHIVNEQYVWNWLLYDVAYAVYRSWLHERANATAASNIEHYNAAIWGYYIYEIQKGASSTSQSLLPMFLAQLQLPAVGLLSKRREWTLPRTIFATWQSLTSSHACVKLSG